MKKNVIFRPKKYICNVVHTLPPLEWYFNEAVFEELETVLELDRIGEFYKNKFLTNSFRKNLEL